MSSDRVLQCAQSLLSGLRRTVLCVDDNPDTIELLALFLGCDYDVSTAADVQSACTLIERQYFDLFILDTRLPDGTGIGLLHRIQGLSPNTPVLFVSADTRSSIRQEARAAGAQEYLVKPVDPNLLVAVIRRLMSNAESKVPDALAAESRVILEELQLLCRTGLGKSPSIDPEQENQLQVKARRAFLRAGGTRALFERLWPSVLADALQDISVAMAEPTPSSADTL